MQLTDNWTPERIRELIAARKVTQAAFAESMHMSVWTIKQWLNGYRQPGPMAIQRLRRLESWTLRKGETDAS